MCGLFNVITTLLILVLLLLLPLRQMRRCTIMESSMKKQAAAASMIVDVRWLIPYTLAKAKEIVNGTMKVCMEDCDRMWILFTLFDIRFVIMYRLCVHCTFYSSAKDKFSYLHHNLAFGPDTILWNSHYSTNMSTQHISPQQHQEKAIWRINVRGKIITNHLK